MSEDAQRYMREHELLMARLEGRAEIPRQRMISVTFHAVATGLVLASALWFMVGTTA